MVIRNEAKARLRQAGQSTADPYTRLNRFY